MPRAVDTLPLLLCTVASCTKAPERPAEVRPATSLSSPSAATATTAAPPRATRAVVPNDGPRVYAKARFVYVYPEPSSRLKWIGYLSSADSVRLKSSEPVAPLKKDPCSSFYAVVPKGYVCVDGEHATLDPSDPVYRALLDRAPDPQAPLPYGYGESIGAKRWRSLPGVQAPNWPSALLDPRLSYPPRSTIAWTGEVLSSGATYLWASDLGYVPKDRVKPFPKTEFHGVVLKDNQRLPLAFFKRVPRPKYRMEGSKPVPTGETWPRLGHVLLTGKSEQLGEHIYYETVESGLWVNNKESSVVLPAREIPWKSPPKAGERRTWIEVDALDGWLVAYEETRPVFVTMISAGKLGAARPRASEPHQLPATTPTGTYQVRTKFVTTTLRSELNDGTEFVHSEVPWSQHFYSKYLLHTAYWHDQWGEGRSGGCVNLSPIDAQWLFGWTQPSVPEGWHAYKTAEGDPVTWIVIHR